MRFALIIFVVLLGCQSVRPTDSAEMLDAQVQQDSVAGFIDLKEGNAEIRASSSDLIRDWIVWRTLSPSLDKAIVTPLNLSINKIYDSKNCLPVEGAEEFECKYSLTFTVSGVGVKSQLVLEIEREGRLLSSVSKRVIVDKKSNQRSAAFHKVGSNPGQVVRASIGDMIQFTAKWGRGKYGSTTNESNFFGLDLAKRWEQESCQGSQCEFKVFYEVVGSAPSGGIAISLVNQGNSIRTWQQRFSVN